MCSKPYCLAFWKKLFRTENLIILFQNCLSLTRQLMPPEKMVTSAAKFSILILWYPVCTPLIPCHSHRSRRRRCLQQHTATWRVDSPVNFLHDEGKGVREEIIYMVLDWILFRAICISQRYLSPKSRNENKNFQMTMSKALAKSTEVITIVLLSLLETSIISQRSLSLPSMPNNLLFVWEPADLITLWHAPLKMKEENIYKTICFESSENFDFREELFLLEGFRELTVKI